MLCYKRPTQSYACSSDNGKLGMHEYDTAFKLVLQSVDMAIRELAGTTVARWLNVELPEVRNTRVDLLGESPTGELVHIELQASNDSQMALRMAEYCLNILRLFGKLPHQVLVYLGEAPLRMTAELKGPALSYSYRLIDIRELDGERLLESPWLGDNIVAILTRLRDPKAAVHRVLARIAGLPPGRRGEALKQLITLAGLRKLGEVVEGEARTMPILNDIIDHEVLGREFKKGRQLGREEGRHEAELSILQRQAQERFGAVPDWVRERLRQLSPSELEALSIRLLKVSTVEELFQ